jgi:hypothetical protein
MKGQENKKLSLILVLIIISITIYIFQTTTFSQAQITNFPQSLSDNYSGLIFPLSQTSNWMNITYGMPGTNLNQWSNIPTTWTNMYSNQAGAFMSNAYDRQRTGMYQFGNLSSMGMNQFVTQSDNWMNSAGFLSGSGINRNLQSIQSYQFGTYLGNWANLGGFMTGNWTNPISYQSTSWAYVPPSSNQSGGCGCGE